MNEIYRDYPRVIQDEIKQILDKEIETPKPKKKGLSLYQKLRLTLYLLRNKASK